MKIQCEYCGSYINDTDEICSSCGAVNKNLKRVANGVPTTIEELKLFCKAHNLPLEQMRFFIGENYTQPRAYGIYLDEASGEFIVYKNKADGTRAIRYQGKDEAYAVHEIYLKIKSEIENQKKYQNAAKQTSYRSSNTGGGYTNSGYSGGRKSGKDPKQRLLSSFMKVFFIVIFVQILFEVLIGATIGIIEKNTPSTGYYQYQSDYYYYYDDDWYIYDTDSYNWYETTIDETMEDDLDSYYSSYGFDASYGVDNFQDSEYYDSSSDYDSSYDSSSYSDWDDDWDDDYDWDSGSDWDSSYSDWDSDW